MHIKDTHIDEDKLNDVGIMATSLEHHVPKLPGLGQVDWGRFIAVLTLIKLPGSAIFSENFPDANQQFPPKRPWTGIHPG